MSAEGRRSSRISNPLWDLPTMITSSRSSVIPRVSKVLRDLPTWHYRPNSMQDTEAYKKAVAHDLGVFRHRMMEEVRGGGSIRGQMRRLYLCCTHKDELLRALQAVRQVSAMSLTDPSFYKLLRGNIDAVREQALTDSLASPGALHRLATNDLTSKMLPDPIMMHHSKTVTTVVEIMVAMLIVAVPARYAEDTAEDRNNLDRNSAAHRVETMATVLSRPPPEEIAGGGYEAWCKHISQLSYIKEEDPSILDGTWVHPLWFEHDQEMLPMIGYKDFAWAIGMKEIHESRAGVHLNPGKKKLTAVEHVLMYTLRTLLSNLIAELEVQVNMVLSIELKILGSFASVMAAIFTLTFRVMIEARLFGEGSH